MGKGDLENMGRGYIGMGPKAMKVKKDKEAERLMAEQKKKEDLRLAEETSDLAKTKSRGLAKSSLIKTSQTGITSNVSPYSKTTGGAV